MSLIKEIIKISLICYLGLGIVLFIFQSSFVFRPDTTDFQNCPQFKNSEKITFNSSRGYFTKTSKDKVIVFYHGNAGRACDRDYLEPIFASYGYSTYFVEYSGYAESNNKPTMDKVLKNVTDTIDFIKTQNFKEVTVIGESVGVGPASYHAKNASINNLVLITAYNNFASVAFSHYPVYPMSLLLLNNFTPDKWLSDYKGPLSMILAEKDEIVPNKLGIKLYNSIPSSLKNVAIIKDAGHNTIYEKEEFYNQLKKALEK